MSELLTFINSFGTKVTFSSLGASIHDIQIKDRDGKIDSIVMRPYLARIEEESWCEFGKTLGRTAGRISNGKFDLNGQSYQILSDDKNGLHGGKDGLSHQIFNYQVKENKSFYQVDYSYVSSDLESGYPGKVMLKVSYRFYKLMNVLEVIYKGKTSKDTLLNLSNHTYFNLNGDDKEGIINHELYVNASYYEEIKNKLPVNISPVNVTFSYKKPHFIKEHIFDESLKTTKGYDHPYLFDQVNEEHPQIILKNYQRGRQLMIKTTYPSVVIYTANYLPKCRNNFKKLFAPHQAICFECMFPPNSINSPFIENKQDILKKGETYNQKIIYSFSTFD